MIDDSVSVRHTIVHAHQKHKYKHTLGVDAEYVTVVAFVVSIGARSFRFCSMHVSFSIIVIIIQLKFIQPISFLLYSCTVYYG